LTDDVADHHAQAAQRPVRSCFDGGRLPRHRGGAVAART
jgi:hypothetical protein